MPEIELRIVLDSTLPGVRGGIQMGSGSSASVPEWQQMTGESATFIVHLEARHPLKGKAIQKDSKGRFIYIVWRDGTGVINRRAKIYVESITEEMVASGRTLTVLLPGKAKDGLPCCATVKPMKDWH